MYRLSDRNRRIGEMFSSIAPRYDFLNRLLSLGMDRRWRREAVAATGAGAGGRHLDVATGTADVALEIIRQKGKGAYVVAVDLSDAMMRIGRAKASRTGAADRIAFVQTPGEALPFRDASFDSASIAFGIRNVAQRELGLAEMCRVVKPGGRIVVLEFSQPGATFFGALYRFYFGRILPRLGGLFSSRSAYSYLPDSVWTFPSPESFAESMSNAGCKPVTFQSLTYGIVTLYVGVRRPPSG